MVEARNKRQDVSKFVYPFLFYSEKKNHEKFNKNSWISICVIAFLFYR